MQGALSESETFLDTWTLVMGLVFVLVVLFLPQGLAGAGQRLIDSLFATRAGTEVARRSSQNVATPPSSRGVG
jgi:urea transport system permease protein